jgi:competence ComEA-like helix-hairpin-helix protein
MPLMPDESDQHQSEPLRWWNLRRVEAVVLLVAATAVLASFAVYAATRGTPSDPVELEKRPVKARIRVNSAAAVELTVIPGIGAKSAAAIVAERDKNGPFISLADLASRVKGVKEAKLTEFEQFLDFGKEY